jgi:hypothetical protein
LKQGKGEEKQNLDYVTSTCSNDSESIKKHHPQIQRLLEKLKRDVCTAHRINVFAQAVIIKPFCLTRQKTQPTLPAFLKYLPTWHSSRYI